MDKENDIAQAIMRLGIMIQGISFTVTYINMFRDYKRRKEAAIKKRSLLVKHYWHEGKEYGEYEIEIPSTNHEIYHWTKR